MRVTITIAPPTTPLEKLALHYFAIRTISSSTAVVYVVKSPNIDQIADPNLPDSSAITSNIFPALSSSPESTVQSLIMPSTFLSTAVSSPASSITASPPEMTDNQYFRGSRDFIFYLLARDNGTPRRLTSRARVTIRVLDVNDMPPMISINYLNVPNSFPSTSSSPGGLRFPVNSAYRTSQTASSDGYSSFYLKPAPEVSFRQASEPALVTSGTNRGYLVENRARALVAFVSVRDYDSGDWGRVRCHTDNEAFTLVPMLSSQSFPSTSRTVQTETRVNRVAMDLFGSNKGGTLGSENIPGSLGSLARDPNLNGPVMDANQEAGYKLMATKALDREETPEVSFRIICVDNPGYVPPSQFGHDYIFYEKNVGYPPAGVAASMLPFISKNPQWRDGISDNGLPHRAAGWDIQLTGSALVTVKIRDVNDCSPVFSESEYIFTIEENQPNLSIENDVTLSDSTTFGISIGRVIARDADQEGQITYGMSKNPETAFHVDSKTGHFYIRRPFDREALLEVMNTVGPQNFTEQFAEVDRRSIATNLAVPVFAEVFAFDGVHNVTVPVRVLITDDNDCPPIFEQNNYEFIVAENERPIGMGPIGRVSAVDRDVGINAVVTYHIDSLSIWRQRTDYQEINDTAVAGSTIAGQPQRSSNDNSKNINLMNFFTIGTNSGQLHVVRRLDREKQAEHIFKVLAVNNPSNLASQSGQSFGSLTIQGATPGGWGGLLTVQLSPTSIRQSRARHSQVSIRHTATATVTIHVADVNDNTPVITFPSPHSVLTMHEIAPVGHNLFTVEASDSDYGENATLQFTLKQVTPSTWYPARSTLAWSRKKLALEGSFNPATKMAADSSDQKTSEVNDKSNKQLKIEKQVGLDGAVSTDRNKVEHRSKLHEKLEGEAEGTLHDHEGDREILDEQGNDGAIFTIDPSTGLVLLARQLLRGVRNYLLVIGVHDMGRPIQRNASVTVNVHVQSSTEVQHSSFNETSKWHIDSLGLSSAPNTYLQSSWDWREHNENTGSQILSRRADADRNSIFGRGDIRSDASGGGSDGARTGITGHGRQQQKQSQQGESRTARNGGAYTTSYTSFTDKTVVLVLSAIFVILLLATIVLIMLVKRRRDNDRRREVASKKAFPENGDECGISQGDMTLCLNSSHRSHGVEPSLACSVFHSASPATYPYSPTPVQANLFPAASLYRSGGDRCIQSGSNCSTLHPSESSISRPELFLLTQNSADYEANFELCAVPTSATIGGTSGSLETKINSNRLHGDHNVQTPVGIGEINRVCLEKLPHIGIKVECGESDASCDEKDGYALSHKDSQYREQQKSSMHFSPSTANDFYERKLGGAKLVNLIPMGEYQVSTYQRLGPSLSILQGLPSNETLSHLCPTGEDICESTQSPNKENGLFYKHAPPPACNQRRQQVCDTSLTCVPPNHTSVGILPAHELIWSNVSCSNSSTSQSSFSKPSFPSAKLIHRDWPMHVGEPQKALFPVDKSRSRESLKINGGAHGADGELNLDADTTDYQSLLKSGVNLSSSHINCKIAKSESLFHNQTRKGTGLSQKSASKQHLGTSRKSPGKTKASPDRQINATYRSSRRETNSLKRNKVSQPDSLVFLPFTDSGSSLQSDKFMFKAIEPEFNSDAGKSGEINANSGEPSRMADNFAADNASLNAPDAMRNVGVKWNAELATTESKVLPTIGMTSHIDEASFV